MKKWLPLFLFLSFALASCENTAPSLAGNWELTESKYIITAGEDFTFVDVFGAPWAGTIKIDDKEFNPSLFNYYFDNSTGQNHFASQELLFTFMGPILAVGYQGVMYILEEASTFKIAEGMYQVEGTAKYQDKSITVHLDLTMPKIALKKGDRFSVRDAYRYIPYSKLGFDGGGKLRTDFLSGDILERLSGKWSVNNDQLNISVKDRSNDTYQYQMNANSLMLSQDKTTEKMEPPHISPFAGKISRITYQALYMKE